MKVSYKTRLLCSVSVIAILATPQLKPIITF